MKKEGLDELIKEFNRLHIAQAEVLNKIKSIRSREKEQTRKRRPQNTASLPRVGNNKPSRQASASSLKPTKKSSWYHCHTNQKFKKGDKVYIVSKLTAVGNNNRDQKATVTG